MRKNLSKITTAAGLSLALAFAFQSCSSDTVDKMVCKKDGFDWDDSAKKCIGDAGANGYCPAGTTKNSEGKCVDEDNSTAEYGIWWTFADSENDQGSSTIKASEKNGSITVSGNIDGEWGVGWGTSDDELMKKAKASKSVSFDIKGDGKKYKIRLNTTDITDFDTYTSEFTTTTGSKKVTLCIADFKQEGWGTPKAFTQSKIEAVVFAAHSSYISGKFGPITISDLTFGNDASCGAVGSGSAAPATYPCDAAQCCDWGMASTAGGGGCWGINADNPVSKCETEFAKVVTICNESHIYCYYGEYQGKSANCWAQLNTQTNKTACTAGGGQLLPKCPEDSLCKNSSGEYIFCPEFEP